MRRKRRSEIENMSNEHLKTSGLNPLCNDLMFSFSIATFPIKNWLSYLAPDYFFINTQEKRFDADTLKRKVFPILFYSFTDTIRNEVIIRNAIEQLQQNRRESKTLTTNLDKLFTIFKMILLEFEDRELMYIRDRRLQITHGYLSAYSIEKNITTYIFDKEKQVMVNKTFDQKTYWELIQNLYEDNFATDKLIKKFLESEGGKKIWEYYCDELRENEKYQLLIKQISEELQISDSVPKLNIR